MWSHTGLKYHVVYMHEVLKFDLLLITSQESDFYTALNKLFCNLYNTADRDSRASNTNAYWKNWELKPYNIDWEQPKNDLM